MSPKHILRQDTGPVKETLIFPVVFSTQWNDWADIRYVYFIILAMEIKPASSTVVGVYHFVTMVVKGRNTTTQYHFSVQSETTIMK